MTVVEELGQNRESGAKRLEAEYKAGLMTLARRFCTDESDAEELVNRTFAAVVEGIDDYLEQSAFFGWMCQILSNIHAKDVRKKSSGVVSYPGEVPDVADEAPAVPDAVDAIFVRDAVESLPDEMRELVVLRYFTGLSVPQIAKFLAIPAGTVKSRLHYAHKALAAKLGAAAKKPGVKAMLVALALCAITALGALTVAVVSVVSGGSADSADSSVSGLEAASEAAGFSGFSGAAANEFSRGKPTMNTRTILAPVAALSFAAMGSGPAGAATVAEPASSASLPASIEAKTALWLDASKNLVLDSSGNLVAWLDARETALADYADYEASAAAASFTHPRAVVWQEGEAPSGFPTVVGDAPASFGGKPYVDFGEYHDNKWMLFVGPDGAHAPVTLVGYAGVLGFGETAGFVVGHVDDPDLVPKTDAGNGSQFYHKGAAGSGEDAIYSGNNGYGRYGETRKNGHVVKSTTNDNENRHTRNGWETFVENGPNVSGMVVSTLFNNGNFKASVKEAYTDRQGGGRIAEIVILSEMLTQEEVADLEAYFRAKWLAGGGDATATVALPAGDTLAVQADGQVFVGDIAGAGAIEKTGSSSLTVDRNGRLAAGPLALREGGYVSWAKRAHHAPLLAIGGKTVTASASTLSVRTAGDADTFTVNESVARRVALAGAESGVAKIAASKAAISLRPQALPAADAATAVDPDFLAIGNLIENGSFEKDAITASAGYQQSKVPTGWSVSAKKNTNASSVGITTTRDTTAWLNYAYQGLVPDGDQALLMQVMNSTDSTNGIQQTVTVPQSGLYEFSAFIRCRYRPNNTDKTVSFRVYVDGTQVLVRRPWLTGAWDASARAFTTTSTEYEFKRVATDVALSKGNHVIEIVATNPHTTDNKQDRAIMVDDVRLEPVAPGDFVLVPDANFSSCDVWSETEIDSSYGGNFSRTAAPFWTISSGALSRFPSTWFCNPIYNDSGEDQQAALQNNATATQTVTLPRAGRVRVSVRYANRSSRLDTGATRASGQTFSVSLGDSTVFSTTVTSPDMATAVAEIDAAAGAQQLVLRSYRDGSADLTTIVDDVRIEYVGSSDRALDDAAFAANSSTWSLDGASAESDPYGLRELVFSGTAKATATFSVPSDGYYLLTFQSRGRPLSESGQTGIYHSFNYYSHNLDVRLDGGFVANVYNAHVDRFPVELRLPYLTAGEHALLFSGSSDGTSAATAQSRISDVTVTPLATGAIADWSKIEFDLAGDATIDADFPGTVRVGRIRVDGKAYFGSFTADDSSFVTGPGTVEAVPEAFVLVVR